MQNPPQNLNRKILKNWRTIYNTGLTITSMQLMTSKILRLYFSIKKLFLQVYILQFYYRRFKIVIEN